MTKALFGPFGLLASPANHIGSTPLPNGCGTGLHFLGNLVFMSVPEQRCGKLFNFVFLELNMLSRDGIVFFHYELFSQCACIFLGDIIEAGARCALELNFHSGGFGHFFPQRSSSFMWRATYCPYLGSQA
jgi:hypothetical protein